MNLNESWIERFVKTTEDVLHQYEQRIGCKRKAVYAYLLNASDPEVQGQPNICLSASNATSPVGCSNEPGNCGCIHAEILLGISIMRDFHFQKFLDKTRAVFIVRYSPCTNCANFLGSLLDTYHVPVRPLLYYVYPTVPDMRGIEILKTKMEVKCLQISNT